MSTTLAIAPIWEWSAQGIVCALTWAVVLFLVVAREVRKRRAKTAPPSTSASPLYRGASS